MKIEELPPHNPAKITNAPDGFQAEIPAEAVSGALIFMFYFIIIIKV